MSNSSTLMNEMQTIVRQAAEPYRAGESIKAQINRAADALGLSTRRTRSFWYADAAAVLAEEADRLRAWHARWVASEVTRLRARAAELEAEWGKPN